MLKPQYQFQAEEDVITSNLLKTGMPETEIKLFIDIIKNTDPARKAERNIYIKTIANTLKGRICALQNWYIHDILSKVTGLAPTYIMRIAYDPDPARIIKTNSVNQD